MTSRPKTTKTELRRQLEALRLSRTAADLDDFLARATKGRWSAAVVLEELARQELQERERRSLERRLSAAHLGRFKPIDEFDWNWPTQIDRSLIDRALGGELVRERENLVLVAAHPQEIAIGHHDQRALIGGQIPLQVVKMKLIATILSLTRSR